MNRRWYSHHQQFVLRTVGDSYHQRFNDTSGDKGIGDRSICSSDNNMEYDSYTY